MEEGEEEVLDHRTFPSKGSRSLICREKAYVERCDAERQQYSFVLAVLKLFSLDGIDAYQSLFWRMRSSEKGPEFLVLMNDIFWWATADVEPILPGDLPAMEQAINDILENWCFS